MPQLPSTWSEETVTPSTYTSTPESPSTWLVNPQPPIDTWDDANRTWDSDYTWDGTIQQTTDAVPSSWTEV
jgi:hypothetical protein